MSPQEQFQPPRPPRTKTAFQGLREPSTNASATPSTTLFTSGLPRPSKVFGAFHKGAPSSKAKTTPPRQTEGKWVVQRRQSPDLNTPSHNNQHSILTKNCTEDAVQCKIPGMVLSGRRANIQSGWRCSYKGVATAVATERKDDEVEDPVANHISCNRRAYSGMLLHKPSPR